MNAISRHADDLPVLTFPNPERRRDPPGPKALAWCAKHIPGFKGHKRDADRAIRHAARVAAKVQR